MHESAVAYSLVMHSRKEKRGECINLVGGKLFVSSIYLHDEFGLFKKKCKPLALTCSVHCIGCVATWLSNGQLIVKIRLTFWKLGRRPDRASELAVQVRRTFGLPCNIIHTSEICLQLAASESTP